MLCKHRKYGGFDNASTDTETTQFYFEIPRKNLLEGLDRFAQETNILFEFVSLLN